MPFKKIKVENFRSFKDIDVNLKNFNILIGPNASGKSNFIEVFRFIRDIVNNGLQNAISMQGGFEYLRNINTKEPVRIRIEFKIDESGHSFFSELQKDNKFLELIDVIYDFSLDYDDSLNNVKIVDDEFIRSYQIVEKKYINNKKEFEEDKKVIGKGVIKWKNNNGKVERGTTSKDLKPFFDEYPFILDPKYLGKTILQQNSLILQSTKFVYPFFEGVDSIGNISIFNLDSKLPRRSTPITGKGVLEEDGRNLALVLKKIIENEENKQIFLDLLSDLLIFVDDLRIEKLIDKSQFFSIKEKYNGKHFLPASLLSDGTIEITALIISLYFEEKPFCIFEEPLRNVHPSLITRFMGMFKECSQKKQILISTHNPIILKNTNIDDILVISRNKMGFSELKKANTIKNLSEFLKNDIGIDDIFVQGLLN